MVARLGGCVMDTKIDYERLKYDVELLLGIHGRRASEYNNPKWVKVLDLRYGRENVDKMIQYLCNERESFL